MKPWRSMLWLFRAGIVAARRQLLAILIMTSTFGLLSHLGLAGPLVVPSGSGHLEVSPALTWSYLLLAVNSVMLPKNLINNTGAHIRIVARRLSPTAPYKEMEEFRSMFWIAAIGNGVMTVAPTPGILLIVSGYFRCSAAVAIGWAAIMSIGVAFFGANALAAQRTP